MNRCLTWFTISGLGKPKLYQTMWCFTRIGDFTWRVSDCEELVGEVNHTTECVIDLERNNVS